MTSIDMKEGERWGLTSQLISQSRFVLENGFERAVERIPFIEKSKERLKMSAALKSLVHPEGMGGVFKMLLQTK